MRAGPVRMERSAASLAVMMGLLCFAGDLAAEAPGAGAAFAAGDELATTPSFRLDGNPLVIHRPAMANLPFSVVGERGAILGQQDGSFELWLLPVKVLSHARLTARLQGYDAAIDLNAQAADVEVRPDHTTITYAHAAITVKQHMFLPHTSESGMTSAMVLFEVHAIRPAEISLAFDPAMEREWPAPNFGRPSGGWNAAGTGGGYLLETDNPAFFGAVMMPKAKPGPVRPYQERPLTIPMVFTFSYDPAKDDHSFYPLLCAVSQGTGASAGEASGQAARKALLTKLEAQSGRVEEMYRGTAAYFAHFFDTRLTAETPDRRFDDSLKWAEVSIEQAKVAGASGLGLAGGWFTSGDSARPGFGWFFGRDTLWTLYAVNSYGDFELSREAMDFLLRHQREDGKMMHEYSQTAESVDWAHLPYLYAAADATPLFVMQMEDYVRASGDVAYLKAHWDNVRRAYAFTRAHTTDGVYDNSQGTGWVEEWPEMPHQEIYLAALDQQSSEAMARMLTLMGDEAGSAAAMKTAEAIRGKLAGYRGVDGTYAFNRRVDGSYEAVRSVFPAVAWWSGRLGLPEAKPTFDGWAGHAFSTDWGERSVPEGEAIYDPISYHHGSVWPLYTGWTSLAEYRAGRSLSGYAHLRANLELTWISDPGAVTEVLSGAFYQPLGRSSSHQLWSSAMVLTPAVRGMFGLEADGLERTLRVAPKLPAAWGSATVRNVAVGADHYSVTMERAGSVLKVDAVSVMPTVLCLSDDAGFFAGKRCEAKAELHHPMTVALPGIEVGLEEPVSPQGARTGQMKVLGQEATARGLTLRLEAPAGSAERLTLRRNGVEARKLRVDGATIETGADAREELAVSFGPASGSAVADPWVTREVRLQW